MFSRKSKKNSAAPSELEQKKREKKEKKRLAKAKKINESIEEDSPVQLIALVKPSGSNGEETFQPGKEPMETSSQPSITPQSAHLPRPQAEPSTGGPNRNHLKAQSSIHIISSDSVTSMATFNLQGENLDCDEETVKLSFGAANDEWGDRVGDEFEIMPTNNDSMIVMRNRLESVPSPRINRSYEL